MLRAAKVLTRDSPHGERRKHLEEIKKYGENVRKVGKDY